MSTKTKPSSPSTAAPSSDAELTELVMQTAALCADQQRLTGEMNAAQVAAAKPFAAALQDLDKKIADATKRLKIWALANRDRFDGQTFKVLEHELTFRLGNPATTLDKGVTWEEVTQQLQALHDVGMRLDASPAARAIGELAGCFIRLVLEPDKLAMIERREDADAEAFLKGLGVRVTQSESFKFNPKLMSAEG